MDDSVYAARQPLKDCAAVDEQEDFRQWLTAGENEASALAKDKASVLPLARRGIW